LLQCTDGSQARNSVSEAATTSLDHLVHSDVIARNDSDCRHGDSAADAGLNRVPSMPFCSQKRISEIESTSVGQSLCSLPMQDYTLPNSVVQCTPSVSCCGFTLQTQPNRLSTSAEIPSSGISLVVVDDFEISGMSSSPMNLGILGYTEMVGESSSFTEIPSSGIPSLVVEESGISDMSQMNVELSDSEMVGEVNVTFEPFCRICQLTTDSQTEVSPPLVSPCRCTGSLQYAHTTCLVVSFIC